MVSFLCWILLFVISLSASSTNVRVLYYRHRVTNYKNVIFAKYNYFYWKI